MYPSEPLSDMQQVPTGEEYTHEQAVLGSLMNLPAPRDPAEMLMCDEGCPNFGSVMRPEGADQCFDA